MRVDIDQGTTPATVAPITLSPLLPAEDQKRFPPPSPSPVPNPGGLGGVISFGGLGGFDNPDFFGELR